jgi:integrase
LATKSKSRRARGGKLIASELGTLPPGDYTDPAVTGHQYRVRKKQRGAPSRSFLLRYTWRGEWVRLTLGHFPSMSLKDARGRALELRKAIDDGIDPRRARPRRREHAAPTSASSADAAHTIETLIADYLEHYVAKRGKNPARAKERVRLLLKKELKPWAGRDARTIKPREVVELLDAIVRRGSPVMANRFSATLSNLFKLGVQRTIVDSNPVQLLIPPGGEEKPRNRVLSDKELAVLLGGIDDVFTHARRTPAVIRLILHTACRRSELALAQWSHFNLDGDAPLWTVPKELSKTGVEYLIPLVPAAVAELRRLKVNARNSAYILPAKESAADKPADPMILTRSVARNLERLGKLGIKPFVLHDLRRTVRTGLARLKIEPHIAERVLNHAQRGMVKTYDLYEYQAEKRAALEKWAEHLKGLLIA